MSTSLPSYEPRDVGGGEPGQVSRVLFALLAFAAEELVGLGQYQRVWPPLTAGLVTDRQVGSIDGVVNVHAAGFGERPVVRPSGRVAQECGERRA